ncbi:GGDEF family protein, partial [Candidatus Thiomargarita nelsonii]
MKIKINHRLLPILFGLLIFSVSAVPILVSAADLTFSPQTPSVQAGGQITLSVSGTSGAVTWFAGKGSIEGVGTQVTYWAPEQVGNDVVSVLDEAGNSGLLKIVIFPGESRTNSPENAVWEVFTNRNFIHTLALSEDEKTLWVGTDEGGLEQREATTGKLVRVFTNLDGLPSNVINSFLGDLGGGLWIGTDGGLVHRSDLGKWTFYTDPFELLNWFPITTLLSDGRGGLWIGVDTYETEGISGLVHRSVDDEWTIYNIPDLPSFSVESLLSDDGGGLWVGTDNSGLAYRSGEGE